MSPERRAVIDVGTNSVKLLVAEVEGRAVHPLLEKSEQTRLGRGFYETHRLRPESIAQTAEAVARFAGQAAVYAPTRIKVIATSAARDAVNQEELIQAIRSVSGLETDVISGEQEADWVYAGVRSDPQLGREPLLIFDIGGGSTEFILGEEDTQHFRQSFPLGTVRLFDKVPVSDPPSGQAWEACHKLITDFLQTTVQPTLGPALRRFGSRPVQLVSTGGTAAILACVSLALETFIRERIEAARLSLEEIEKQRRRFWALPLLERKKIPGLPPDRADVMLFGAAILAEVMRCFGFSHVRVSTRGLRFAAVLT
jgi:exopolyphosphatase/guanosine-5'-triphosphate,3'-diphosphate pyrophosphatase